MPALNKGEARNALARAIFFHSLGELRDRTFENQFFRASGLNLPALKVAFDKVLAAENLDFLSLLIAEAIAGDLNNCSELLGAEREALATIDAVWRDIPCHGAGLPTLA